ncbi:MAG TPA: zinc-dependent alcohol dehydrogenase family protein, partial [Acidimicrobiia bacterium]|nr:zinc-dependent alcohol dehydrogenase family protein [Acidimicrobiia bacterium]
RPEPGPGEVRLAVHACACCRTDLHVVEGDLELPVLPIIPGHQVVGVVDALGEGCIRLSLGDRVGVAWLHQTDGVCEYCRRGEENLCEAARFTGWTVDGGYADAITVPEAFAVQLPPALSDLEAAPLLCAGVIGYRALCRAEVEPGDRVALMGFGASAHLALQVLAYWDCEVVVLTRGERHRALARELGATWVGDAAELPPRPCDRAVVFAPAGELGPVALQVVRPGGTVSLAGIHMSPIPSFDYSLLWRERSLRSVANMTRRDAEEFMTLAAEAPVRAEFETYPLEAAGDAVDAIARDALRGAAVLDVAG